MRVQVAVAVAMAAAFVLPGCLTFEGRFRSGVQDAHVQVSPTWRDPGLYDALPENGTHKGFSVRTIFVKEPLPSNYAPDYPTRVPFDDPALTEAYGTYELALVRWTSGGPAPNETLMLWMGPGLVVQGMIGYEVADPAIRAAFRAFASALLNVSEGRLKAAEDIFAVYTGGTGGGGVAYPYELGYDGRQYHEASMHGSPVRVSESFRSLGGLAESTPHRVVPNGDVIPGLRGWTMQQVLYFCGPCERSGGGFFGQVELVHGNWTFALRTPVRVVEDGPLSDRQLLLVTPDDAVEAFHWDSRRLSDRQAARELRTVLEGLDRDAPDMDDWEFDHGTVAMSEEDANFRWDRWDSCPPQNPPLPGC